MSSEKVVWSVGVSMVTLGVVLSVTQLGGSLAKLLVRRGNRGYWR